MTQFHPDLLARAVPRYTSYPTAADFEDDVGPADMAAALDAVEEDEALSLYVHIPFCKEICAYCGCSTGRANRSERLQSYLEALEREIDLVSQALRGRGRVGRIAFGGGSPNALPPIDFVRLVERLLVRFGVVDPIFSVELDPRSLDADWFRLIRSVGITRASLGVQTFDPAIQAAIGRVQPEAAIGDAVAGLRDAGVTSLNFDLIYGLPGQRLEQVADSVLRSIELGADRTALFGYAHLPSLIHRQRSIDGTTLPSARERFDQAALGRWLFGDHGYQRVGFDHFARPGDPLARAARAHRLTRNFQGFTDDAASSLIGIGASAISQFPGVILQNEKLAGRYRMLLGASILPARRGIRLTADMKARAGIIRDLLCHGEAMLDRTLSAREAEALDLYRDRGLVTLNAGLLRIEEEGWPYARLVASVFDSYRPVSAGQFSHAI